MREVRWPRSGGAARVGLIGCALALLVASLVGIGPPALAAVPHSQLHAVTCVKSTNCVAVGETQPSTGHGTTLIERWNGTSWSIVASPNATGASISRLYAVTCIGSANCIAVGQQLSQGMAAGRPLIERWNGKAWSIVASPSPKVGGELHGVSCASTTACVAVGLQSVTSTQCCLTLVERFNGTKWSIVNTPTPPQSSYSRLNAVTCTSASKCVAVGYDSINGRTFTLVERWNGSTWTIVPSPNPEIGDGGLLNSVACTSATNCMAAGSYLEGGPARPATLIERWNGTKWSIAANAIPPRAYTELSAVACANASSCFTVGEWNRWSLPPPLGFAGYRTLIQRWNGKSWSLATSPAFTVTTNILEGIACSSATDCFAVGFASDGTSGTVLVQHWNGTAWSAVAAPSR